MYNDTDVLDCYFVDHHIEILNHDRDYSNADLQKTLPRLKKDLLKIRKTVGE